MNHVKQDPTASEPASIDEAEECCENIAVLAGILGAFDALPDSDIVEPHLVSGTGRMILRELEKIREYLWTQSGVASRRRRG